GSPRRRQSPAVLQVGSSTEEHVSQRFRRRAAVHSPLPAENGQCRDQSGLVVVTLPKANLVVSFVISTHNRRGVLIRTLAQLPRWGLSAEGFEILVVDNASRDRTADTVQRQFPRVRVIRMRRNRGACAKNIAISEARGRYVIFLDDDSFPAPGSVA